MTKNMGSLDRALRLVVAAVLAVMAWNGTLAGPLALGAWIVVAVFVVTSLVSFCPLYRVMGMDTCGKG
ncbi:MAG: DUF2892 domain-containing protein [Sphingomonadaceae bacterium]